jgi:SMI1/KNR4 family protein SUKH-1
VNSRAFDIDHLIQRLKERATNPERRSNNRPSVFTDRVQRLDLGGLFSELMRAGGDLRRMVAANQEGNVPPDLTARAENIASDMTTPAASNLPPPASDAAQSAAEADLGFQLPPLVRRIYREVADGGFGPSNGLLSLKDLVQLYRELLAGEILPRGRTWPSHLLPVARESLAILCLDTSSDESRVVAWDEDGLDEYVTGAEWSGSFKEEAASLVEWLDHWLEAPTAEESFQARIGASLMTSQVEEARKARARFAAMSPEERAAIGLPEVGWEKVVWGGLGWDDQQST